MDLPGWRRFRGPRSPEEGRHSRRAAPFSFDVREGNLRRGQCLTLQLIHGRLAEIAALSNAPFVVGLDVDRGDETKCRGVVGQDPNDVGASFDLGVEPFERVHRPDLLPVVRREAAKGRDFFVGVLEHLDDEWELAIQRGRHFFHLTFDVIGVGLSEDRADYRRDHRLLGPR